MGQLSVLCITTALARSFQGCQLPAGSISCAISCAGPDTAVNTLDDDIGVAVEFEDEDEDEENDDEADEIMVGPPLLRCKLIQSSIKAVLCVPSALFLPSAVQAMLSVLPVTRCSDHGSGHNTQADEAFRKLVCCIKVAWQQMGLLSASSWSGSFTQQSGHNVSHQTMANCNTPHCSTLSDNLGLMAG